MFPASELLSFLNQASFGILVFDSNSNLLFNNLAASWLSKHFNENPDPTDNEVVSNWKTALSPFLQKPLIGHFQFHYHLQGQEKTLHVHVTPVSDASDIRFYCTLQDITYQQTLEADKLQLAIERNRSQIVRTFSMKMAHDFRTPLTSINTNTYLLSQSLQNTQDQQKNLNRLYVIGRQTERLSKQLNDLLLITELELDPVIELEKFNLTPLIEEICDKFSKIAIKKQLKLKSNIESNLYMNGDSYYLQIAIENILQNAILYSNNNNIVELSATKEHDQIIIQVRDNGVGIKPELIDQVFEPFYRGNEARTIDQDGSSNGLGLSISRLILNHHKGNITINSIENKGTIVTLTLPMQSSTFYATKEIPNDLLLNWDILVADDEPDSLEVARYILNFHGANVHTAIDGQEALEITKQVKPRFIITDLAMPRMSGWDLMEAIKSDPIIQDIPVIALTAYDNRDNYYLALRSGFRSYLTKPLTADNFMQELLSLLLDIPQLVQYLKI